MYCLNYFALCFLLSFMSLFNVLYCSSYSWCSFQALLFAIDTNNFCYPFFFLFNKYRLDTLFVLMGIVNNQDLRPGTRDPETWDPGPWDLRPGTLGLWDPDTQEPRNRSLGLGNCGSETQNLESRTLIIELWCRFQVSWPVQQIELTLIVKQILIIKS